MKKELIKFMLAFGTSLCVCLCGCADKDSGRSDRDREESERDEDDEDDEDKEKDNKNKKESDEDATSDEKGDDKESDEDKARKMDEEDGEFSEGNDGSGDGSNESEMGDHGTAYVYEWSGNEYLYDTGWEFSACDGMIHDGDTEMVRTLTVYRQGNSSSIEYMLESAGEWGEYWHVNDDYPADCTEFDYVEGGTVTITGDRAVWEAEYGEFREIYNLTETYEY